MVRGRLLVTLLTIPALALVACSDEEGLSDEEQEYADAFAITLANDEEGLGVEPDDAECMADALMTSRTVTPRSANQAMARSRTPTVVTARSSGRTST